MIARHPIHGLPSYLDMNVCRKSGEEEMESLKIQIDNKEVEALRE